MDVNSIMEDGLRGINSNDIMNTVNTTVQQTLSNSGLNMNNINVTQGYVPSAVCLLILIIVGLMVVNGAIKAILGVVFTGALLYFVSFGTHASTKILPMLDRHMPDLLRFIGQYLSF